MLIPIPALVLSPNHLNVPVADHHEKPPISGVDLANHWSHQVIGFITAHTGPDPVKDCFTSSHMRKIARMNIMRLAKIDLLALQRLPKISLLTLTELRSWTAKVDDVVVVVILTPLIDASSDHCMIFCNATMKMRINDIVAISMTGLNTSFNIVWILR
ncbi:MAG: hypothetical protein WCG98_00650 [bacterium]